MNNDAIYAWYYFLHSGSSAIPRTTLESTNSHSPEPTMQSSPSTPSLNSTWYSSPSVNTSSKTCKPDVGLTIATLEHLRSK